mmetsp:Transcript_2090/g.3696  ORF Transcript_2090/g.3696 Transcript_2090/m.3696 type:complete len:126 (-) Transcript_2090:492-869(-)|eukprot:CAMPEP_0168619512 /NCGR_PEP_ID=MMETSP0449_2-20121227/6640_1 /TAXON_ID=1082188 /ORGANISM="Strombidium rassoulzadegani, Strain ras09" /LENGTH=125 /DNA_ID=CAMNT_0008660449 /DNA_START=174 /DNA_END=551 /DNA_ORIENTATION=+
MPKEGYGHIRSLKDVREIETLPSRAKVGDSRPAGGEEKPVLANDFKSQSERLVKDQVESDQIVCPLTLQTFNGVTSFLVSWDCGCVYSQAGLKELKKRSEAEEGCIVCSRPLPSLSLPAQADQEG